MKIRLGLPRTRSSYLIGAGIFGLIILAALYVAATDPDNRAGALIGAPLLCLALVALLVSTTELDCGSGSVTTTRVWVFSRRVDLGSATRLGIGPNNNNRAVFGVKGAGGEKVFVDLVHCSTGVNVGLDPAKLGALADAVERFAPADVPRRGEVIGRLREQADFLSSGGRVEESPLAAMATASLARSATNAQSIFTLLE